MLLFGKILSIFYPKWVYLICIALFEVGSLICASAPNPDVLIFGRAFAGVGAAGLWIGVMSLFARVRFLIFSVLRGADPWGDVARYGKATANAAWGPRCGICCMFGGGAYHRRRLKW